MRASRGFEKLRVPEQFVRALAKAGSGAQKAPRASEGTRVGLEKGQELVQAAFFMRLFLIRPTITVTMAPVTPPPTA